jgi:CheY-like chemotaxis protein
VIIDPAPLDPAERVWQLLFPVALTRDHSLIAHKLRQAIAEDIDLGREFDQLLAADRQWLTQRLDAMAQSVQPDAMQPPCSLTQQDSAARALRGQLKQQKTLSKYYFVDCVLAELQHGVTLNATLFALFKKLTLLAAITLTRLNLSEQIREDGSIDAALRNVRLAADQRRGSLLMFLSKLDLTLPLDTLITAIEDQRPEFANNKTLTGQVDTLLRVLERLVEQAVNAEQRNALLEIMDDRYGKYSTVVVSQLPTEEWYASLGDNTLADAILDRLMHNAHRLSLKGESMRKRRSELTQSEHSSLAVWRPHWQNHEPSHRISSTFLLDCYPSRRTLMLKLERILHVEDDPSIRAVAKVALEAVGGFEVLSCSSGQEALDNVLNFATDLILLDVMMPGMDGPQTLARLVEVVNINSVPVVFMTAKVQPPEVEYYLSLGARDVIIKPFDPMQLANQVRTIWSLSNE